MTEAKLAWELQEMKGITSAREAGSVRENAQERERIMMQSIMESQGATEEIDVPFAHSQHEAVPLKQKIVELERVKAVLTKLEEIKQLENIEAKLTRELREINEVPSAQQMATGEAGPSGYLHHRFMGQQMARKRERMMMQRAALESLNNAEGLMTGITPSLTQQSVELKRFEAAMAQLKQQEAADSENITTLMPVAQPAAAGSSGAISGKMTDAAGAGIFGFVYAYNASSGDYVASSLVSSDGSYTIGGLPTGSYKVYFSSSSFGGSGNYISEWYNDKSSIETADAVSVTDPDTTVNINAVLAEGGRISGKMTNAAGAGLSGYVNVYNASSGIWVTYSYTSADGSYTVSGLPTGSYKVEFHPDGNYFSEWYNDKLSIDTADAVSVAAPDTTANINAVLAPAGSISGKITDSEGRGLYADVTVYDASSGDMVTEGSSLGGIEGDGSYTISGLPTGSYKVEFHPYGNYLSEWYNDKSSISTADVVTVTAPDTTANIDAVLVEGGSISGKMTDTAGAGIAGYVFVYDASSGSPITGSIAGSDGSYTVSGLPTGSYKVYFSSSPFGGSGGNYISEWYNDKSSLSTADAVSVTAPNTTANIDAVLAKSGSISGKMTDAAGVGVAGYVTVYDASSGSPVTGSIAGSDGSYTVSGLPTGSYKVYFSSSPFGGSGGNYISEWYNDKSSLSTADAVSVTAPNTTANIDAVLAKSGSISGKMTDAAGVGVAGYVYAYNASSRISVASGFASSDGSYTIGGLPTGSYKVYFTPQDNQKYVGEWYNNKSSMETADSVSVTAPNTTANINATLERTGSISGKVTDAKGTGVDRGYVYAYGVSSYSYLSSAQTQQDGSYTINGLPAGRYKVSFSPGENPYVVGEWYNNGSSINCSDWVTVTSSNTTVNINAVLAPAGSISGKMTNAAGTAVTGYVFVYNASSGSWVSGRSTGSDGSYSIGGLPAGSYKVEFSPNGNYLGKWYNNKSSSGTADSVSVTELKTTANINAVLAEGGSISGKMTNAAGVGIAGEVGVYDASSGYFVDYSYTSDGSYTVGGLRTGSYKVEFYPYGSYVGEWYSDKSSFDTAATVSVTAPNTTADINAVLAEGGSISGKITDATGAVSGRVAVYSLDGGFVRSAYASDDGSYKVDGLRTGSYKVRFSDYSGRNAGEWYNDKNSFTAAEAVAVTAPNTTANINAILAQGGSIKGKMTTPNGGGIYSGFVVAYASDDKTFESGSSVTDGDGGYVISGLKTGAYKVLFYPESNSCSDGKPYVDEWYNNRSSFSSADLVQVTSPNTTSGVNAAVDIFKGGIVIPIIINTLLQ